MGRKTLRACIPLFLPEKLLKAVPFVSGAVPAGLWLDPMRLQRSSGFNGTELRRIQRMIEVAFDVELDEPLCTCPVLDILECGVT